MPVISPEARRVRTLSIQQKESFLAPFFFVLINHIKIIILSNEYLKVCLSSRLRRDGFAPYPYSIGSHFWLPFFVLINHIKIIILSNEYLKARLSSRLRRDGFEASPVRNKRFSLNFFIPIFSFQSSSKYFWYFSKIINPTYNV